MRTNRRLRKAYADVRALIDDLGYIEIAEKVGRDPATVRGWRFCNAIPRRNWPEMILAYRLSVKDMLKLEAASKGPPSAQGRPLRYRKLAKAR